MSRQGQAHHFYEVGFLKSWIYAWVGDKSSLPISYIPQRGRGQSFIQLTAGHSPALAGCGAQDQPPPSSNTSKTIKTWRLKE